MKRNQSGLPKARRAAGFTLVELMVVILIIVVLAGIGFPVFKKMSSRADDSKCVQNYRTWSTTIASYASDNSGMVECRNWNSIGREAPSAYVTYFAGDGTHESSYRTLGVMRCCPALKGKAAVSSNGNSLTAHTMTDPTGSSSGKKIAGYSLAAVKQPSRFVIMIEAQGGQAYMQSAGDVTSRVRPLTEAGKSRHGGNVVNALMGDFSIRSFDRKDVDKNATIWTTF